MARRRIKDPELKAWIARCQSGNESAGALLSELSPAYREAMAMEIVVYDDYAFGHMFPLTEKLSALLDHPVIARGHDDIMRDMIRERIGNLQRKGDL